MSLWKRYRNEGQKSITIGELYAEVHKCGRIIWIYIIQRKLKVLYVYYVYFSSTELDRVKTSDALQY